jgi:hypothetical protein
LHPSPERRRLGIDIGIEYLRINLHAPAASYVSPDQNSLCPGNGPEEVTAGMKLFHHSLNRLERFDPELLLRVQTVTYKPRGLWVSDADAEDNWQDWCVGERFRLGALRNRHLVTLHEGANVLRIATTTELDWFTRGYSRAPEFAAGDPFWEGHYIDWPEVTGQWDGIVITPYLWQRRLGEGCFWYYGWDCASGCIWNARAIADFRFDSCFDCEEIEGAYARPEYPRLLGFGEVDFGRWG